MISCAVLERFAALEEFERKVGLIAEEMLQKAQQSKLIIARRSSVITSSAGAFAHNQQRMIEQLEFSNKDLENAAVQLKSTMNDCERKTKVLQEQVARVCDEQSKAHQVVVSVQRELCLLGMSHEDHLSAIHRHKHVQSDLEGAICDGQQLIESVQKQIHSLIEARQRGKEQAAAKESELHGVQLQLQTSLQSTESKSTEVSELSLEVQRLEEAEQHAQKQALELEAKLEHLRIEKAAKELEMQSMKRKLSDLGAGQQDTLLVKQNRVALERATDSLQQTCQSAQQSLLQLEAQFKAATEKQKATETLREAVYSLQRLNVAVESYKKVCITRQNRCVAPHSKRAAVCSKQRPMKMPNSGMQKN